MQNPAAAAHAAASQLEGEHAGLEADAEPSATARREEPSGSAPPAAHPPAAQACHSHAILAS